MKNNLDVAKFVTQLQAQDPRVRVAFKELMGTSGDVYAKEIYVKGHLTEASYKIVSRIVASCDKETIVKHFGIIQWYYFRGGEPVSAIQGTKYNDHTQV